MPANDLDKIFKPENIALIGASEDKGSVGFTLMENLKNRPKGELFPVNPNREETLEVETFSSVTEVSEPVDLAVIATPAQTVPNLVRECGETGIMGLIILSAGFSETGDEGAKLEEEIKKIREEYGMRIIGPNCLGIINPAEFLNASFTDQMPESGEIAFISQSGALASATLDWAISAQFGFSSFVSVGNMVDVDFSDLIDYFGRDPGTGSILMYIEAIEDARNFSSAARGFARTQPIMAVKSGKHKESAEAIASHTGSLAGADEVYNSVFKRFGITRVDTIDDLFSASETLAKQNPPEGPNLAIVTNAGGPGAMATDALMDLDGSLAELSESTIEKLRENIPSTSSLANPIDVTGGADQGQYRKATELCLKDENVDGVLCIYSPVGTLSPTEAAEAISDLKKGTDKPLLACWMGGEKVAKGREILRQGGLSVQPAPEQSVKAYMYLNRYARNLERLLETPEELPVDRAPPKYNLKAMIRRIARDERELLTEVESKKILRTYGIPCPEIHTAETEDEAARVAAKIGFPVVLKINSHEITHKSRAGGVELNLNNREEVKEAHNNIMKRVEDKHPSAKIQGVTVQKMIKNKGVELILGSKYDQTFGSTVLFGKGGTEVGYYNDTAVGLPPLNKTLARRLMEETRVYKYIQDSEDYSEDLQRDLEEHLVRLSQLIIDFPEIKELDINPLTRVGDEFQALDARIIIDRDLVNVEQNYREHLVIEPYPRKYVEEWRLGDGRPVTLRPIRPEDEPLEFGLFDNFSPETWRYRFFGPMKEVTHEDMVRFTNIDYRREMAIIGILEENGERKMIGVGRLIIDPDGKAGEYAVVVGDPWQGLGLGEKLTDAIIGVAEDKGLETIYGTIMKENRRMINLVQKMGFEVSKEDEDTVRAVLRLR